MPQQHIVIISENVTTDFLSFRFVAFVVASFDILPSFFSETKYKSAIQRSDRKNDDRFKQSLMTNQGNNLQKIVPIN